MLEAFVVASAVTFLLGLILVSLPPQAVLPITEPIEAAPPSAEESRTYWVQHYAGNLGVDSALALAVSRTENWTAVRNAWSPTDCCVGVMQVNVSVWYGVYDEQCGGSDLMAYRDNACYGVHILKYYLDSSDTVAEALRRYSGHGTAMGARPYVERVMRGCVCE